MIMTLSCLDEWQSDRTERLTPEPHNYFEGLIVLNQHDIEEAQHASTAAAQKTVDEVKATALA